MRTVISLLCLCLSSWTWAFDFKGVVLGSMVAPNEIQKRLGVECSDGAKGMQVCNGYVTVARESASMNLVIGNQGTVQRIDLTLSPDVFDEVAPELINKFGKAKRTSRSIVQNPMGAKYAQVIHLWADKNGGQVLYVKYDGSLDSSTLNFSTKADREMLSSDKLDRGGDI